MSGASQTVETALADLLERERASLLAGRFEELEELNAEKLTLAETLHASRCDPAVLAGITERAAANQRLAAAAGQGFQSALRRLGEVQRLNGGTGHYGSNGARTNVPTAHRTLRRI